MTPPRPTPPPVDASRRTPLGTVQLAPGASRSLKDGDLATPMPLLDFMNELGVVIQLPRKRPTVAARVIASAPLAPVRRRGVLLPMVAVVLLLSVAASRLVQPSAVTQLPAHLRGEWITSNPRYRDRRLSFTDSRVGIALKEGQAPALHSVVDVKSTVRGDTTRFDITYDEDGTRIDFPLLYVGAPRARVVLSNPADVVWERAASRADSAAAPK